MASPRSLRALDWLNFFLADVQTGVGPFLAVYLAANHWHAQKIGLVLTAGGWRAFSPKRPLELSSTSPIVSAAGSRSGSLFSASPP